MKNSSRVGAAALIAAGLLAAGASSAAAETPAATGRIASAEELQKNIQQAVELERRNGGAEVSNCPGGRQPAT